jgi:hypothetical protein
MALKGNLETFFLSSILQLLHDERKTGALQVRHGDDEVRVIVKNGNVVYAMSTNKEARLGNLLRSKGVISLEQLETCLEDGRKKKQALGRVLVERGYIDLDLLQRFIRKQVEEIVYNIFFWETGDFVYRDAHLDLSGLVITQLDITRILLEASRRIDEMSILRKLIPNRDMVFALTESWQYKKDAKLSANERALLLLINGKRNVNQLIDESGYDKFSVYKILYSLITSVIIEKIVPGLSKEENSESDYSAIITGYNNIFQVIWRNLEPEIGKETAVLFEDTRPEPVAGQGDLFKNFHPNNPLPANIFALRENLKRFYQLKNRRQFLVESLNRYILNLLKRIPEIMGFQPTQKMMEEIDKVLPHITRYMEDAGIETNIVPDLKKVMENVNRQMTAKGKEKKKNGGILSRFK